jgi:hypothetical protein
MLHQRAFGVYGADLRQGWLLLEEMIVQWRWWGDLVMWWRWRGVVGEGFGYVVVMAGVVVGEGFGYAVELRALALADGEYRECTAFLRASLAPFLRTLARWSIAYLFWMDSCSCRSLSISCCTLASSSSSVVAASSSASSSQSSIWT